MHVYMKGLLLPRVYGALSPEVECTERRLISGLQGGHSGTAKQPTAQKAETIATVLADQTSLSSWDLRHMDRKPICHLTTSGPSHT